MPSYRCDRDDSTRGPLKLQHAPPLPSCLCRAKDYNETAHNLQAASCVSLTHTHQTKHGLAVHRPTNAAPRWQVARAAAARRPGAAARAALRLPTSRSFPTLPSPPPPSDRPAHGAPSCPRSAGRSTARFARAWARWTRRWRRVRGRAEGRRRSGRGGGQTAWVGSLVGDAGEAVVGVAGESGQSGQSGVGAPGGGVWRTAAAC